MAENATRSELPWTRNESWTTYDTVMGIMFDVVAMVGNLLVVVCVGKYKHLQKRRYVLICSLAISDFLTGFANATGRVIGPRFSQPTLSYKIAEIGFSSIFPTTSVSHVIAIGVDRFLAVVFPLRHSVWVTPKTIGVTVAFLWIAPPIAFCLRSLAVISDTSNPFAALVDYYTELYILTICLYVCVAVSLCALYGKIWHEALKQRRKIQAANGGPQQTSSQRANRLVIAVLLSYNLLYLPNTLSALLYLTDYPYNRFRGILTSIFTVHAILASAGINLIIYAAFTQDFRKALVALVRCRAL